jgi:hypothetical protein
MFDIQTNRDDIIDAFYSMLSPDASLTYHMYPLYKESFQRFAFEVIETNKTLLFQPEIIQEHQHIEEDKYLTTKPVIIKPNKNKPNKTIVDIFNKVEKI